MECRYYPKSAAESGRLLCNPREKVHLPEGSRQIFEQFKDSFGHVADLVQ